MASSFPFGRRHLLILAGLISSLLLFTESTQADDYTWTGGGFLWSDPLSWSPDGPPTAADDAVFPDGTGGFLGLDGPSPIHYMTFNGSYDVFAGFAFPTAAIELNSLFSNLIVEDGDSSNSITVNIHAPITGSGVLIIKNGEDTLVFSGNNSFTTDVAVSVGTLQLAHSNALGATGGGNFVAAGATFALSDNITITDEGMDLEGDGFGGGGALRNISGNNHFNGVITLSGTARINSDAGTLTIDPSVGISILATPVPNQNLTLGGDGNITLVQDVQIGTGTLTKDGNGKVFLQAATNSYTGDTIVNSGDFLVMGGISSNAIVNGGLFGGNGTAAKVTVNSGGTLSAGDTSAGGIGILTVSDTSIATGGILEVKLAGTVAGTQYDQIMLNGSLLLTDATLSLNLGYTPSLGHSFTIINNTTPDPIGGIFDSLPEGTDFISGPVIFEITYAGGIGSNDIVLTVVPEPASGLLALGGLGLLAGLRRRRALT